MDSDASSVARLAVSYSVPVMPVTGTAPVVPTQMPTASDAARPSAGCHAEPCGQSCCQSC
jgi:hypothetical protein